MTQRPIFTQLNEAWPSERFVNVENALLFLIYCSVRPTASSVLVYSCCIDCYFDLGYACGAISDPRAGRTPYNGQMNAVDISILGYELTRFQRW